MDSLHQTVKLFRRNEHHLVSIAAANANGRASSRRLLTKGLKAGSLQAPMKTEIDNPPFFHGRATFLFKGTRFYRVYIMPEELFFLQAGPGGWDVDVKQQITLFRPGLERKLRARQQELDRASSKELLKFIELDKHSFRAAPSDLSDVRIEPRSIWQGVWYSNPFHAGLLRFQHRERGKFNLELLWAEEMHVAVTFLPSLLGEALSINVVWNEKKKRYLRNR